MATKREDFLKEYREKYKDHLDIISEMNKRFQDKDLRTKFYGLQSEITLLQKKKTEQQVLSSDEEKQLEKMTGQLRKVSSEMLNVNKQFYQALSDIVKNGANISLIEDTFKANNRKNFRKIDNSLNSDPENFGSITDRQEAIKANQRKAIRKNEPLGLQDDLIETIARERQAELIQFKSKKSTAQQIADETRAAKTLKMAYEKNRNADISQIDGHDQEKAHIAELEAEIDALKAKFQTINEERTKNKALAQKSGKNVFMPETNEQYFNLDNQISTLEGKVGQAKGKILNNLLPAEEIKESAKIIVGEINQVKTAADKIRPVSPEEILPAKAAEENAEKIVKTDKEKNKELLKVRKELAKEIKLLESQKDFSPEWLEKKKQFLKLELDQTKATEQQKQKIILESEKTLSMKLNGSKDKQKYYDTVKFLDKDYLTYRKNLLIEDVNNTKLTETQKALFIKAKMADLKREQKSFYSVLGGMLPALGMPLTIAAAVGSAVYGSKQIAQKGIDTENQLKLLQAVGAYDISDLEKLKDAAMSAALAVGAIPAEVIKLEQALSRNGKSVQEITDSVGGIQNFAKVYQTDFEQTADVASKVSNIFGVTMPRALDVMAVTMRETTINGLDEFADALSKGSAMADALGYTVEETMALIGVAINKGMNPQDASNGMQKLLSQAKDVKGQFAQLTGGKAANNFEELTGIIKKLTDAEKENLLVKWQGKNLTEEQSKILTTVILNSIDKVEELKTKIVESNGTIDRAIGDAMSSTSNMYGLVKQKIIFEFTEMYAAIEPGIKGILYITNKLLDAFFKVSNEEKQLQQSFRELIALDANIQIVKEYTLAIQNKDKAVLNSVYRKNEYLSALGKLKEQYPDLLKNLDAEKSSYADIAKNMEAVTRAFENKIKTELAQSKLKDIIEEQVNFESEYARKRQMYQQQEAKARNAIDGKAPKETVFNPLDDKGIHVKTREEYVQEMLEAQTELKRLEAQYSIKKTRAAQNKKQVKDVYGITDADLAGVPVKDPSGVGIDTENVSKQKYEYNLAIQKTIAENAKFEADNDLKNFDKKRLYIEENYKYQKELLKKPLMDFDGKNPDMKKALEEEEKSKLNMLNETKSKDLKQLALDEKNLIHERLTNYLNYLNTASAGDENQHFRNIEMENTQHLLKLNNLEKERIVKGGSYQQDYELQKNLEVSLHNQRINNLNKENALAKISTQETALQGLGIGQYKNYDSLKKEISLKGLRDRTSLAADDPDYISKYQNSLRSEQFETGNVDKIKAIDYQALEVKKLEIKREYGEKNIELEQQILEAENKLRRLQIQNDLTQTEEQRNAALLANEKEFANKSTEIKKNSYSEWVDTAKQAYDMVKQISNTLYEMEVDNINRSAEKKQKILDKEYKANVKAHQGANKTLAKIDEEYEKNKEALEDEKQKKLKQAKQQQQKWAIAEAVINWGLGITEIWGKQGYNPIAAGILTALLTGVMVANIAQITAQKFSKGVIKLQGSGGPESDNILAKLSPGETVLTARETDNNIESLTQLRRTGRLPEGNLHASQLSNQNNKIIGLLQQIVGHSKKAADETEMNNKILDGKEFTVKNELPLEKVSPEGIYRLAKYGEEIFKKERY